MAAATPNKELILGRLTVKFLHLRVSQEVTLKIEQSTDTGFVPLGENRFRSEAPVAAGPVRRYARLRLEN